MRYHKINGEETIRYLNDERERAMEVSLTSLASSFGYTPVRQGVHFYLKEMDSLVIYNDKTWHRWSGKGNITGGTQIDFMLEFGGASSVPEAIQYLLEFKGEPIKEVYAAVDKNIGERKEFILPPKNDNYRRLYAYLIKTRCLSPEVISSFVQKKLIYEDAVHHNIVYCGYDPEGVVRYAGLRGTADGYGKAFKMDVPGNDKNYGVNMVNKDSDELKVFEAVIDCMSYIDMYGDNQSNKLVLGMVEDNPLAQFLKDYSHIKRITFCLDNDKAATKAIYGEPNDKNPERQKGLKKKYKEQGYIVKVENPPYGKDYNESLQEIKKSTAQVEKIKSAAKEEIDKRVSNVDIKKYISLMAAQGCTLLETEKDDILPLNFFDLRDNKKIGFDSWKDVDRYLKERMLNISIGEEKREQIQGETKTQERDSMNVQELPRRRCR